MGEGVVSLSKANPSAFSTSSYSETKINLGPEVPSSLTLTMTIKRNKHLFIVLPPKESQLNSEKDCSCFQDDLEKGKGARGLETQRQEDDKLTYGEQDPGFGPEFKFPPLPPGGERGGRMGRASRAFAAARFHQGAGSLQEAWGPACRPPGCGAHSSAGRGRTRVSSWGRPTPPARIPGARRQLRPGSPIQFPRSLARRHRLHKQPVG